MEREVRREPTGKFTIQNSRAGRPGSEVRGRWFKDRSGNSYLDDSAYRAVMKSNPLPPLPRGYNAYTVALVFTPSGLN